MTEKLKIWNIEEVSNLIAAYQGHSNLWNVQDVNYKNRIKKMESYKEIAALLDTTVDEIDRKLKNILSQYYRERRNYKKMRKSGSQHNCRPKWFGYNLLSFLRNNTKNRKGIHIGKELQASDSSDETTVEQIQTKPKMQWTKQQQFNAPKTTICNKNNVTSDNDGSQSTEVFRLLKSICENSDGNSKRDEYDVYGEMIASNIRKLKTEYARITTQNRINNLIYEAQLGYYDFPPNSAVTTPVVTPISWNNSNHTVTSPTTDDEIKSEH